MAVDITQIGTVYTSMVSDATTTLDAAYADNKIDADTYAKILSQIIDKGIENSARVVQNQEELDARVLDMKTKDFVALAQSQKDIELKGGQLSLNAKQIDKITKEIEGLSADISVKTSQKNLIDQQKVTEVQKGYLTRRQEMTYNDHMLIEKADKSTNLTSMLAVSGGGIDYSNTLTSTQAAIDAVVVPDAPVLHT